jgi:glycosyltransferase involved in cell wall biosynthesis
MTLHKNMIDMHISVLMSIYSEPEEWLREAIDSILNQTFTDFEFIIINDNPKRNLNDIILGEYQSKDNRIIIVKNEENLGLIKSLNIGLRMAKGKYIARMDADDISLLTRLEKQFSYMELNPQVIACGSWIKLFGLVKGKYKKHYQVKYDDIITFFFIFSPFAHPTLFLRNAVLKSKNLHYDENFEHAEDYRLAFELIKNGELSNIPEVLLKYRINSNQISKIYSNVQIENSSKIRRLAIDYFLKQLNLYLPIPQKVDLNYIMDLKKIQSDYKKKQVLIDAINVDKRFNVIRMISFLSLEKYSIKSFIYFLFSWDYLYSPYTIKRFIVVIYKHFFQNKWPRFI